MFQISLRIVSFVLYINKEKKENSYVFGQILYTKIEQIIKNKLTQIKLNYIYIHSTLWSEDRRIDPRRRETTRKKTFTYKTENIFIKWALVTD